MNEEEHENLNSFERSINTNVVYGQEIQLKHLYSNCYLTVNEKILANEPSCRELSLEEQSNSFSNFKILTINSAKSIGQPILYSDTVIIKSSKKDLWGVGVQKKSIKGTIEVNASQNASNLKILSFSDNI